MKWEQDVLMYNTMSDDVSVRDKNVNISTMSGDVTVRNCTGHVNTMSGDVLVFGGNIYSVTTMSGDILAHGNIQTVETMSGTLTLENAKIDYFRGYNITGIGTIDYLELPEFKESFNIFKPSTWFNNSVNYCSNTNMVIVNGKVISEHTTNTNKPGDFHVPQDIKINKIKTDGKVYSSYAIEIEGKGKLILEKVNNI